MGVVRNGWVCLEIAVILKFQMTKSKYQVNDKYQISNDQKEGGLICQEMWRIKLTSFALRIGALALICHWSFDI